MNSTDRHLSGPPQLIRKDFAHKAATARAAQDAELVNDHSLVQVRCVAEGILSKLLEGYYALNDLPADNGLFWLAVDSTTHLTNSERALLQRIIEEDAR